MPLPIECPYMYKIFEGSYMAAALKSHLIRHKQVINTVIMDINTSKCFCFVKPTNKTFRSQFKFGTFLLN